MLNHFKRNWDKLFLLMIVIGVISWLLIGHSSKERLLSQKNLELELDIITGRMNQLVQLNRSMIEVTATTVENHLAREGDVSDFKSLLTKVSDRNDYAYSLYIYPDKVINGNKRIDPIKLVEQGRKKYGELVYYGNLFFDGERKTLWLPMYINLNEHQIAKKAILYTEIDATALVRDINRLHVNRGGKGYLVDPTGKVISLSLNASMSDESLSVVNTALVNNKLGQNGFIREKGHLISVRTITSTDYKLIYVEPIEVTLNHNYTNYFLISFAMLLFIGVVTIDLKRAKQYESRLLESIDHHNQTTDKALNTLCDWVKEESAQVKVLYNTDYSSSILEFKAAHCLRLLSDSEQGLLTYPSNEFINWTKQHLLHCTSKLILDDFNENETIAMSPAMLQAGIHIIERLRSSGDSGSVVVKTDKENQMIIFNCFGEVSKLLLDSSNFKFDLVSYNPEKDDVSITLVGSKIVLCLSVRQKQQASLEIARDKGEQYPNRIYFYENEMEQNAILKFYLDYLKIPYEVITSLKGVPDNSVVMITETVYLSLTEADNIGVSMPYRFIVCGDLKTENVMDTVTVNRPYALEKIEFALNRIAQKQND